MIKIMDSLLSMSHVAAVLVLLTININNVAAVVIPEESSNSTSSPGRELITDNDDTFIPYRGERFSIFDWNLCRQIAKKYRGNFLISPISLKLALVLLYEGAQDETAHELAGVMHLPVGAWATRDKFSLILRSLQPISGDYELNLGTRIFMNNGVMTKQSYAAILKTFYDTDIVASNFSDTHTTASSINSWVKNITNGNIPSIIDDESKVKDSTMLVMNALYFKGLWYKNKFMTNNSRLNKFFDDTEKSIDVMFMNALGDFYYTESMELDAKILRIPYVGRKFAMYVILPRAIGGLELLMKNMNPFILTRYVLSMQKLPVYVSIPKFKFQFTSLLEPVLRELGIRDIFDNTAILTGIAKAQKSQKLIVSNIIQKAGIEFNEEGTTAYAATEVNIGNKVAEQVFNADHPFIFYIEDEVTGTILYMGRVNNPTESNASTETPGRLVASRSSSSDISAATPETFEIPTSTL